MTIKKMRNGVDFDLVNISLLGFDPVTGRSFQECNDEWQKDLAELQEYQKATRWWHLRRRLNVARQLLYLEQRQGMAGMSV